jgi:Protein of unknown function (DUF3341)
VKRGIAAEFADEHAVLDAIERVRERGLTRLEVYGPVGSDTIDAALGEHRSSLSIAAGIGALFGAVGAYALQWYLVAYLYPIDVGGRPPHMPLPYLIITIEMGFLFGALVVFVAFLVAARLVKLWDPINEVPGIESATRDKFWLAIDGDDPALDRLGDALEGAGQVAMFGGAS